MTAPTWAQKFWDLCATVLVAMPAAPAQTAPEAGTCAASMYFFNFSAFIWFDLF